MENNDDLTFGPEISVSPVTTPTALAHEQLAKDEQFVGVFIATLLLYMNRDKYNITDDKFAFTEYYKDTELTTEQQSFAKKVVEASVFRDFLDYINLLLSKSVADKSQVSPLDIFLDSFKKGDKAFLIRQIFRHTDQILEKYRFLDSFCLDEVDAIDLDLLNRNIWQFPIEQKVLCLTYIFSQLDNDSIDGRLSISAIIKKNEAIGTEEIISSPEEQAVYKFFNAFYIQFLLQKDFSNTPILKLDFLGGFVKDYVYATQRVFIKKIISDQHFKVFSEEMKEFFLEYNSTKASSPCSIFMRRINKDAFLKQVFGGHGKYRFLKQFLEQSNGNVSIEELYNKIWHLSQEQQIIIFAYIFSTLEDTHIHKRKSFKDSFYENCQRVQEYNKQTGRGTKIENENIEFFLKKLTLMEKK